MTVMVSPSFSTLPTESLITLRSSSAPSEAAATAGHSWPHSGQTRFKPSS